MTDQQPLTQHTVLVVDDDEFLRQIYVENFKEAGYRVLEAKDGQEGWQLTQSQRPDLVFTGIMMPNMTGFEFLKAAHANADTARIPFLIFSHLGRPEDKEEAMKLGSAAFLVKGEISPKQVMELVNSMLEKNTYRVSIDTAKFDAVELSKILNVSGEVVFDLTPDPGGGPEHFHATLIKSS